MNNPPPMPPGDDPRSGDPIRSLYGRTRIMEHRRLHWVWRLLIRSPLPDPAYYWLLDRLTDNNGWRPLSWRETL